MRTVFELIDSASHDDGSLRAALYLLGAQVIAHQAVTVAVANSWTYDGEVSVHRLIEQITDYPGVTMRPLDERGERHLSDATFEAFMSLGRNIPALKIPPL